MPTRIEQQKNREQVRHLVLQGHLDGPISESLGCSLGFVENIRRSVGINRTSMTNAEKYRAIYLILETDLPFVDIAAQVGCSVQQISKMGRELRETGFSVAQRKAGYRHTN